MPLTHPHAHNNNDDDNNNNDNNNNDNNNKIATGWRSRVAYIDREAKKQA